MSKYLQESYDALLKENIQLIEQSKKLSSKLEIAEKALEHVRDYMRLDENWKAATFIDETLKAIRE